LHKIAVATELVVEILFRLLGFLLLVGLLLRDENARIVAI
jgi:hypothetical protein